MPANVSSDQLSFVNPSEYFMQVAQTTSKIQAMPSMPHAILIISIQKIKNAPARVFHGLRRGANAPVPTRQQEHGQNTKGGTICQVWGPQRIRFHISGSIKVPDAFNPSLHRRITADPSDHNFPYCGMLKRHNQWR
jgi:hypothetical protein